jgi:hypothetical protein
MFAAPPPGRLHQLEAADPCQPPQQPAQQPVATPSVRPPPPEMPPSPPQQDAYSFPGPHGLEQCLSLSISSRSELSLGNLEFDPDHILYSPMQVAYSPAHVLHSPPQVGGLAPQPGPLRGVLGPAQVPEPARCWGARPEPEPMLAAAPDLVAGGPLVCWPGWGSAQGAERAASQQLPEPEGCRAHDAGRAAASQQMPAPAHWVRALSDDYDVMPSQMHLRTGHTRDPLSGMQPGGNSSGFQLSNIVRGEGCQ